MNLPLNVEAPFLSIFARRREYYREFFPPLLSPSALLDARARERISRETDLAHAFFASSLAVAVFGNESANPERHRAR